MTWFQDCCLPPITCDLSLDAAIAAKLEMSLGLQPYQFFPFGSVDSCRIKGDVPEHDYGILRTFNPSEGSYNTDDTWRHDVLVRLLIYSDDPVKGMRAVRTATRWLENSTITFAFGYACLDRPSIPQQFGADGCLVVTQVQWNFLVIQPKGIE